MYFTTRLNTVGEKNPLTGKKQAQFSVLYIDVSVFTFLMQILDLTPKKAGVRSNLNQLPLGGYSKTVFSREVLIFAAF